MLLLKKYLDSVFLLRRENIAGKKIGSFHAERVSSFVFTDIHTTKWSNMAKSWLATIAPTGSNDHGLYYNMANNLIYISGI